MTTVKEIYQEGLDLLSSNSFHYNDNTDRAYEEDLLDYSGFEYRTGASKVVLILDDCVLKTSFNGTVEFDEDGEEVFVENFPDYAKMEYDLYQAAKERGIEFFFAKTTKVNDSIYEQPRVDATISDVRCEEDTLPDDYFPSGQPPYRHIGNADAVTDFCEKNGLHKLYFNIKFNAIRYFLGSYSIEELKKLNDFLTEYDINDISATNCGWIDGRLVIFDFCGFDTSTGEILSE
ncbi:MAG: hypothetical protein IKU15_03335 [Clostridia bacterium]|nr:hypothetical protein [Clostridia bacterium]